MMPFGRGGAATSDSSLSHPSVLFFFFFFTFFGFAGGGSATAQTLHSGTRCAMISASMSVPGTFMWQLMQEAVANEP